MFAWIITVRIGAAADHNFQNKVTKRCPLPGTDVCTDSTGAHHSYLIMANNLEEARHLVMEDYKHITRIEGPFSV